MVPVVELKVDVAAYLVVVVVVVEVVVVVLVVALVHVAVDGLCIRYKPLRRSLLARGSF